MVADDSSVILWIDRLKQGNPDAAAKLWDRYSQRMQQLARVKLRNRPQAGFDEEDVALSAFGAFCTAVQQGRYLPNDDTYDLWALLATFTVRKLNDRLKFETASKRGGDAVPADAPADPHSVVNAVPTSASGPQSNAILAEEYRRLFNILEDPELEQLAVLKLEGYTNDEVAQKLGYTRRTIQRMLNLIRTLWQNEKG